MVQAQLAVTQSDLAMEAAEVKRLAGKIEQMKEERSSVVQRMALALQERNDEVNAKSEEIARLREMIDRREAESLAQGEEQAYEIARLREMIDRREAESLAQAEGPTVALRQAYEDLKNKLRREQEANKRTSAELAKLKSSLGCGEENWDEEVGCESLRREVEDLKCRLRMSEEVYTAAVVECKTLRKQLQRANKLKGKSRCVGV
jgi:chromosome segregation ATPase